MERFNKRILSLILVLVVLSLSLTSCAKKGAVYPSTPITYVLCFDPGGESDITARFQQPVLTKLLSVPIAISYITGGGGGTGWSQLTTTTPDGYTIFGTNLPHIIVQPLTGNAGYKTEQIDNIYMFESTPCILVVGQNSPIRTFDDFLKYAKAHPGMSVGGSGEPSSNSLALARLAQLSNLTLTYVSFTGSGTAITALLGGHVDALMTYTSTFIQYKDKWLPLAVATEGRLGILPDVPTFKELGYDLVEKAYRGVAVPPGTPENIRKVLEQAFEKVNQDPEVIKEMENLGFIMENYNEAQSKALVDQLTPYYTQLLETTKKP